MRHAAPPSSSIHFRNMNPDLATRLVRRASPPSDLNVDERMLRCFCSPFLWRSTYRAQNERTTEPHTQLPLPPAAPPLALPWMLPMAPEARARIPTPGRHLSPPSPQQRRQQAQGHDQDKSIALRGSASQGIPRCALRSALLVSSAVVFLVTLLNLPGGVDIVDAFGGADAISPDSFKSSADVAASMQTTVAKPALPTTPLDVPAKLLMGPGPSTPHPRVLAAASIPMVGHMHPEMLRAMDDVKAWLKYTFQTSSDFTIAVSGSGHAAMEASVATVVEPGDVVLVGVNGIWGERMTVLAARYGADVRTMTAEAGHVFSYADVERALQANPGTKVVFLVHGESSTGTLQPLTGLGDLCHAHGALLFVDAVCTLGGVPLHMDQTGIDVVYSGSQKCLGAPVAPSPLSLSPRARQKFANRTSPVQSYYFDMNLVGEYWAVDGVARKYHHTGMVSNMYALREALAMVAEEGLESVWKRHQENAEVLHKGIQELGLEFFVPNPAARLPTVTTIKVPPGVDWLKVNGYLMSKYNLEIAGGLGPTVGKVWRVGLMGNNARPQTVALLLSALRDALTHVGYLPANSRSRL